MPARLEIQPEVKTSAASLPCRSASSRSSSTIGLCVPEMLRVPPAPAPCRPIAAAAASSTVRVAAHAEIVVRAPDRHVARRLARVVRPPERERESARRCAPDWRRRDSASRPSASGSLRRNAGCGSSAIALHLIPPTAGFPGSFTPRSFPARPSTAGGRNGVPSRQSAALANVAAQTASCAPCGR